MTTIRTNLGPLQIRRATLADFDGIKAVILDVVSWLESRGSSQWNQYRAEAGNSIIRDRIESTETFLVFDPAQNPIATFSLQWEDTFFWADQGSDGTSGYVHGLAVRRCAAGKNLGADLLDFAAGRIAKKGRRWLRLDCHPDNKGLCDYYSGLGFAKMRIQTMPNGWHAQLFQRAIKG